MVSYLPIDPPSTEPYCVENQGNAGLAITWILLTIAVIVVSLRMYVKLAVRRNHWWDDYTAVASLVVGLVTGGFFTKIISDGMGRHIECLYSEEVVSMLEYSAISEGLNVLGIGIVKISVCLTLLRVVDRSSRRLTYSLWFLLVFVALTHFALAMTFFLHCRPLAALWNPRVHGSCMSTHTTVLAGYVGFAIDVVTDVVCAIIPVIVIKKLRMNTRTKVALCVLMGLGVFTAVCAVAKAITLKGVFAKDSTWGFTTPATWAVVEQFVGIIIASIPALKPLLRSIAHKSWSRSSGSSSSKRSDYLIWAGKYFSFGSRSNQSSKATTQTTQISRRSQPRRPLTPTPTPRWSALGRKSRHKQDASIDSNMSTLCADKHYENRLTQPSVLEKGFQIGSLDRKGQEDWLWGWELPDVSDRRSGMFSIPHLQSPRRSLRREESPRESWQDALRRAL